MMVLSAQSVGGFVIMIMPSEDFRLSRVTMAVGGCPPPISLTEFAICFGLKDAKRSTFVVQGLQ